MVIRAETIKTEGGQIVFTGVLIRILCVVSDPNWLKLNREFISSYNQTVQCRDTFIFCLPWWLFLTPFSGSSPTVVPRWCQNSWICMYPVLEQREKANCAFLMAQSKVLEFSLLVTRDRMFTLERWPGVWDMLIDSPWSWRWASSHPNGILKKYEVLDSSKRDMDAGKVTSKYPSQPHNIRAWPLFHVQQGWGCPFTPWVGQVWSEDSAFVFLRLRPVIPEGSKWGPF